MVSGNNGFFSRGKREGNLLLGLVVPWKSKDATLEKSNAKLNIPLEKKPDAATNSLNCHKTRVSMALRSGYKKHSEPNPQELTYCPYLYINLAYIQCHQGNKHSSLQNYFQGITDKTGGRGFPSAIVKNNPILILESNRGKLVLD